MSHVPVLLHEAIEGLSIVDGDVVVDATLGNAGHSQAILNLKKDIRLIGIDLDRQAIERSKEILGSDKRVTFVCESYRNLKVILEKLGVKEINKILFDFGFSSDQIAQSGRGFSFQSDEPLLMTFSSNSEDGALTAYEIVNSWSEEDIRKVIRNYGEERFAGRIAKGIVKAREKKPIGTTFELVDVIKASTPFAYHRGRIHPATRTFQALRIAVNDELEAIQEGLEEGFRHLAVGGRIVAISFHSHEDRIVKHMFRAWSDAGVANLITKKPITPSDEELLNNPRARSAKMRVLEKI
ncbi:MAG: 16S rRNA (cytosine(1402)-N(4))-methyltransferase [Candidatus Zambryskibacteria bacterium RIFCSPHIGHO2_01_FULL_43_27]|uniref:Ribosomal RNA small subunit methyltransferase H n=1 Tax=Candidatus Zambryskibacteria bacterium RIFCSPLOWO2_01_FULL_43_17 TaxID=1802760 RepID=A0A1G2U0G8_9BACT|nr:MAG: 16S rRNA (cytosine(1402)-N(4))-methyltransferase [Candidatus Zambryskibacteria bacterium RIFCSPHIGHO2_01_FULL_43_27]OHB00695.1 MAG: 16S rRNA (cytosine(1402)-N(4))-methyltransferase [Candidatus Zambryskibacteria bacterium RIFCSPHIGHO2_12_FULL_43_12b]OHB02994.1 MAG: 16S rRNA (cytosine(1402)-N(4))-methyltransferase [Candidatus Zambryskibacteria bacterium RIFCSPLOWO2_01_FULL_43_17]